jgi:hypothetical protein
MGRGLAIAMLLCASIACSDIRDQEIASDFVNNRPLFDHIVEIGLSTDLSCHEASGNIETCSMPVATTTFDALRKRARIQSINARHDIPQLGNAVYFTVASYGLVTMSSYSKGIVYSTNALQPVVNNTEDRPDLRFRFNRIAEHWYVFIMP